MALVLYKVNKKMVYRRAQRVDDNIVKLEIPETGIQTVSLNGEVVVSRGGAEESLEPVYFSIRGALVKEESVNEWIKDRERTDDYPDGDESLPRYVLMREYSDGSLESLEYSDSFETLEEKLEEDI